MTKAKIPTVELLKAGQSPWLDYISRDLLKSGKLQSLIKDLGVIGVTSNPSIFEKAINQTGGGYDKDIKRLIQKKATTFEIYDALTIKDIQDACDRFLPIYKSSNGEHGFVSLEVAPNLAYLEEETIQEAKRLFKAVKRKNVMIKVPATPEGVRAIRALIGSGININVTLMFSMNHYRDVANAYIQGLEDYAKSGGDISKVHSVASVFVSRIDSLMDKQLELLEKDTISNNQKAKIRSLKGKAAIANSKLIYREYERIFGSRRFKKLQKQGAWIQKVLWGSTSVKNPDYHDLLYVENLIGPETVNTMPKPTLDAFADHGKVPGVTIKEGLSEAESVIRDLETLGYDLNAIGEKLQQDGAKIFCDAFDSLMQSLEKKQFEKIKPVKVSAFKTKVDKNTAQSEAVLKGISKITKHKAIERFFEKDASLWKDDDAHQKVILNRLGWIHVADWMLGKLYELDALQAQVRQEKIQDVVLLGMGGSSLAPEVMSLICKKQAAKRPRFQIVDTTDPDAITRIEKKLNLKKSLFIVASKSGTTAETLSQYRYFYDRVRKKIGGGKNKANAVGRHFIAITDEGSWLSENAKENKFRNIFINPTDIGGRFSALSLFGMVPAALMGLPVKEILRGALDFIKQAQTETSVEKNPGFYLGGLLGGLANAGVDKMHLWLSPKLSPFAAWIEQLVAESTGKEKRGIIPVANEAWDGKTTYGKDSYFVVMRLKGEKTAQLDKQLKRLKQAGRTAIELEWQRETQIGAEFLRWEIATSVASFVLGVNPFDEPNVKESKDITGKILSGLKRSKKLKAPAEMITPASKVFKNKLSRFADSAEEGGYIAILAYVERSEQTEKMLQKLQMKLFKLSGVPVLYGFGPRYLHSIGQLYKGGPLKGSFLQILKANNTDMKVPESHFSFGQLIRAQALGDLETLKVRKLKTLVVELSKTFDKDLKKILGQI